MKRISGRGLLIVLGIALVVGCVLALGSGSVDFSPARLWQILLAGPGGAVGTGVSVGTPAGTAAGTITSADVAIIWQLRLPRTLLAGLVGLSLGASGALLQGLFRNPMADPYVVGVSSGAALGATLALATGIFGVGAGAAASTAGGAFSAAFSSVGGEIPAFAFLGAIAALGVVYLLARVGGAVPVMYLLLAGVVVSSIVGSLVALVIYFHPDRLQPIYFWLLGNFSGATWRQLAVVAPYVAAGLVATVALVRPLNLLLAGEEASQHLGLRVEREKLFILGVAALLTAAAVALSGMIGFVGLVAPHVVRLLAGPDHRFVVPGAALLGAVFLVLADTLARTIVAPLELPVGVVTALVGGPFFLYLLRAHKTTGYRGETL